MSEDRVDIALLKERIAELEAQNRTLRAAQKACEFCDEPRVSRIAELEAELTMRREQAEGLQNQWVKDTQKIVKLEAHLKHAEGHVAERDGLRRDAENLRHLTKQCCEVFDCRPSELAAKVLEAQKNAARYLWLYPHHEVVRLLKIKAPSIPCPDKLEYCAVAHYGPVTKAMIDIAIDAALQPDRRVKDKQPFWENGGKDRRQK